MAAKASGGETTGEAVRETAAMAPNGEDCYVLYNGKRLAERVSFRRFRKAAARLRISYDSWEEGCWIEASGASTLAALRRELHR
ncbi:U exon [Guinea pig adenovirus 1]|uniref:U exon n=1 Tax=Guinea pig adenovirus 1 TaxID=2847100 RepID=A0AC61M009_9ADEN|nr:U exon [Guinea pig adenovirus]QIZ64171.1 U exon [Guinea pig adenovirus 1]QIZ64203.1 U exon [Guinea pig adenovirus]